MSCEILTIMPKQHGQIYMKSVETESLNKPKLYKYVKLGTRFKIQGYYVLYELSAKTFYSTV